MPVPVLELPRGSAIEPLHSALAVPLLLSEETLGCVAKMISQGWEEASVIIYLLPTTVVSYNQVPRRD